MTVIGEDLCAVIKRARRNPVRWGKPKGLRQEDLAKMAGGISTVYVRQIESGYRHEASAAVLGSICYALGIDPEYLRRLPGRYDDVADVVADCVAASTLLGEKSPGQPPGADEDYIRKFPGLTDAEKDQLTEALREIRKQEPLGKDLWRRRGA